MRTLVIPVVISALALLAGCGSDSDYSSTTDGGNGASGDASPAWLLAARPADAVPVSRAKQSAAEGDVVAVHGRIGGRRDPMSTDVAVFVIMDPAIPSCAEKAHDSCPTPWDYCCETPESKMANSATVQLVDAAGAPLAIDLATFGTKPLDEIIVVGMVGPRPTADVLTIRATGFHRMGG
jgi:hypothetical protein